MFRARKDEEQSEVMDHIYEQIQHIPDEAVPWIKDNFSTAYTKYPSILDAAITERFSEWLRKHPERRTKRREFHCNDCGGSGLLHVMKKEQLGSPYCFQCACRQFGSKSIPIASLSQLLNDGYVQDSQELVEQYKTECQFKTVHNVFENYEQVLEELKQMAMVKEMSSQDDDVPF
jgi:hypothetical protein